MLERWLGCSHLFACDHSEPRFDVGEGMRDGEDCLSLVLLMQLTMRPAIQGERGGIHEAL